MLSIRRKEKIVRVPKSRPVDQISPDSYLGNLALEKLTENRRDNPDDEPSSSKYSTSSESDSDSRTAHKKPREKLVLLSDGQVGLERSSPCGNTTQTNSADGI